MPENIFKEETLMKTKMFLSMMLATAMLAGSVHAMPAGNNTELPDVNTELPATLSVLRGLESVIVPFKSLDNSGNS